MNWNFKRSLPKKRWTPCVEKYVTPPLAYQRLNCMSEFYEIRHTSSLQKDIEEVEDILSICCESWLGKV
jgi:hypothetical protein